MTYFETGIGCSEALTLEFSSDNPFLIHWREPMFKCSLFWSNPFTIPSHSTRLCLTPCVVVETPPRSGLRLRESQFQTYGIPIKILCLEFIIRFVLTQEIVLIINQCEFIYIFLCGETHSRKNYTLEFAKKRFSYREITVFCTQNTLNTHTHSRVHTLMTSNAHTPTHTHPNARISDSLSLCVCRSGWKEEERKKDRGGAASFAKGCAERLLEVQYYSDWIYVCSLDG